MERLANLATNTKGAGRMIDRRGRRLLIGGNPAYFDWHNRGDGTRSGAMSNTGNAGSRDRYPRSILSARTFRTT